jgi:small subunit ribosomal protein S16
MQRTGRSGHAQFRVVVQDVRQTPTSGKVVALLGTYDPHTKALKIDKEKVSTFMKNGAQPSTAIARLLKKDGVKLPDWLEATPKKTRAIRNVEKLRKNRPAEPAKPAEEAAVEPAETTEAVEAETAAEEPAETPAETPAAEAPESLEPAEAEAPKE